MRLRYGVMGPIPFSMPSLIGECSGSNTPGEPVGAGQEDILLFCVSSWVSAGSQREFRTHAAAVVFCLPSLPKRQSGSRQTAMKWTNVRFSGNDRDSRHLGFARHFIPRNDIGVASSHCRGDRPSPLQRPHHNADGRASSDKPCLRFSPTQSIPKRMSIPKVLAGERGPTRRKANLRR